MKLDYWLRKLRDWGRQQPGGAAILLIFLVYSVYLPTTEYQKQYYDADSHWVYARQYFGSGKFSFLAYENYQRGYLFSLLLAPLTRLAEAWEWHPLQLTRPLGAAVAALIFGWAGPALWQAVRGENRVPLSRRLVFAAFGFALWRDYFNFSLTDFPALLALCAALVLLLRRSSLGAAFGAGVALAMAVNFRPVYQVAIPVVLVLALLPVASRARWWGAARVTVLMAGAALVLFPQAYSNKFHAGTSSPWVLTTPPGQPNLFLQQLGWGLQMQKYETNIGDDYGSAQMRFEDHRGKALLQSAGLDRVTEAKQYRDLCLGNPARMAGVFSRHLFNALDLQYPTPYIVRVFVPTWKLAWLNYSLIWAGLLGLLAHARRRPAAGWPRLTLVLLALLLPCLTSLPTAIECRFFLPLHLLLSAAVAFGGHPRQYWRASTQPQRAALLASYLLVVVAAFSASASAQSHLATTPRHILDDLPLQFLRPKPVPEPW